MLTESRTESGVPIHKYAPDAPCTYLSEPYEYVDRPLAWHLAGRQQTASGYGKRLTSSRCVRLADGRIRRVYVSQWANAGTAWIIVDGRRLIVY